MDTFLVVGSFSNRQEHDEESISLLINLRIIVLADGRINLFFLETTSMSHTTSDGSTTMSLFISSFQSPSIVLPFLASALSSVFVPNTCPGQNKIGIHCNISSLPCNISQPCRNNGNCTNDNTTADGYVCACPRGFDGAQCQLDNRPCKPNTCWNNGITSFQ